MESVLETTVLEMAAAVTEIGCHGIGTVSIVLVLKTVFLCSSEQGDLEQTVIGDVFDQFGGVPRGLLPIFSRWFGRSLILWDFCCDEPDYGKRVVSA